MIYVSIPGKTAQPLSTGSSLSTPGTVVVDGVSNHQYTITTFLGGFLLDGCPINVVLGQGWLPGQQTALIAAGLTQCVPAPGVVAGTEPNQSQIPTGTSLSVGAACIINGNPGIVDYTGTCRPINVASGSSSTQVQSIIAAATMPSVSPGNPGSLPQGGGNVTTVTPSVVYTPPSIIQTPGTNTVSTVTVPATIDTTTLILIALGLWVLTR